MIPLTELQIKALHKYISDTITDKWRVDENPKPFMVEFARAIERAHGIGA
ncbi:hypothetical protein UFOVP230_25 [uncultured Caudovirales phage]|uniref:Uncharacterized protein n=1 Tax=uncultured Caudovirales phage TaxID=2100421 RepID=A0A6J7XWQ3_9CAUD|nr:hypothetical protein UFOVP230_25 [uncultured Caudovirales phage]